MYEISYPFYIPYNCVKVVRVKLVITSKAVIHTENVGTICSRYLLAKLRDFFDPVYYYDYHDDDDDDINNNFVSKNRSNSNNNKYHYYYHHNYHHYYNYYYYYQEDNKIMM